MSIFLLSLNWHLHLFSLKKTSEDSENTAYDNVLIVKGSGLEINFRSRFYVVIMPAILVSLVSHFHFSSCSFYHPEISITKC